LLHINAQERIDITFNGEFPIVLITISFERLNNVIKYLLISIKEAHVIHVAESNTVVLNEQTWTQVFQALESPSLHSSTKFLMEHFRTRSHTVQGLVQFENHVQLKNALVFSQLSIALCDGDASHLVDQHKHTQNGHQAWHNLMTYFYWSNRSVRAARVIRAKLGRLTLTEEMTASAYINKFQTWHRDLLDINNGEEGFSTDTKIQAFLDNIKHPRYLMTVGCIKSIPELDMETAIDQIRQTETDLDTERGEKRKMSVLRRQFYVEDGFRPPEEEDDLPGYVPVTPSPGRAKKRRGLDNPGPTKLPKEIELKKSGAIHIVDSETWNALPQSDKDFVSAWNSHTQHKESTKDIKVPTGVTLKPHPGSFQAKQIRRQVQEGKSPTAAMVKAVKKRIHFGLEFSGDEIEDVDPDFHDDK
jgi:hypothetical protein